ncbi:MAG TPA: hypothetical protein VKT28_19490 [Puia sp.]|nr:hypothetical protein [Puia sp.]
MPALRQASVVGRNKMQDFKTRFNYLTFSLMFIGFVVFIALGLVIIIYGRTILDILSAKEKNKIAMYIGLSMVPLGISWMIFFWGRILKNYRSIITLSQNSIIQKDAIFFTVKEYSLNDIEGYSDSIYLGDILMKTIVINLKDGSSIKILNYLTHNFENLKLTLKLLKIKRLKGK